MKVKIAVFPAILVVLGLTAFGSEELPVSNGEIALAEKPNIIYIMADDAGYGDFGFNGQDKIKTPNLDQMAREGIVFNQHYSGSAVCAPSRAALMTGINSAHGHVRELSACLPFLDLFADASQDILVFGYPLGPVFFDDRIFHGRLQHAEDAEFIGIFGFHGFFDLVVDFEG